jgi:hypothetical protein
LRAGPSSGDRRSTGLPAPRPGASGSRSEPSTPRRRIPPRWVPLAAARLARSTGTRELDPRSSSTDRVTAGPHPSRSRRAAGGS